MKLKINVNRTLRPEMANLIDGIEDSLNASFHKIVSKKHSFADWEKFSSQGTSRLSNLILTDFKDLPSRYKTVFGRLLTKAWRVKYNDIISKYKTRNPTYVSKYNTHGGYSWYWRKRIGKGRYRPTHRPNTTIKYSTWALATGFLRESMGRAFANGGTNKSWLNFGNPLLQVVANIDEEVMMVEDAHYYFFLQHLIDLGVIDDIDDFVSLLPEDVEHARRKLINVFVRDFARDFARRENG